MECKQIHDSGGFRYVMHDGFPWFDVESLNLIFTFEDIMAAINLSVCANDIRTFETDNGEIFTINSYGVLSLMVCDDGLCPPGLKNVITHEIIPRLLFQWYIDYTPINNRFDTDVKNVDDVEDVVVTSCKMNVFDKEHWDDIEKYAPEKYGLGYVYIAELGNRVKIGCSQNPFARLKYIDREARCFGGLSFKRVAVTPAHSNYQQNETAIHRHFKKFRVEGSEFFNLAFDTVVVEISQQNMPIFLIDSSKRTKVRIENLIDTAKTIMMNRKELKQNDSVAESKKKSGQD